MSHGGGLGAPLWSVDTQSTAGTLPIAGLPGSRAIVIVGPPLLARGPRVPSSVGEALMSLGLLNPQDPSSSMFHPDDAIGPSQAFSVPLAKMLACVSTEPPTLSMSPPRSWRCHIAGVCALATHKRAVVVHPPTVGTTGGRVARERAVKDERIAIGTVPDSTASLGSACDCVVRQRALVEIQRARISMAPP